MLNSELLKARLSQYGVAWLLAFALGVVITLAMPPLLGVRLTQAADLYLPAAFGLIGLALVAGLALGLLSREAFHIKLVLLVLTVILALPLFWAPVLGCVLSAAITHVSIEYSQAYAGFRILVGQMIFPISEALFEGALWDTVWKAFQIMSSAVGFLISLLQLWGMVRRLFLRRETREREVDDREGQELEA